jgi:hypothetical protein
MRCLLAIFAAAVVGIALAQQFAQRENAAPAPLERVTALMRDYARGVTEYPFDAKCGISYFDLNGKLEKARNTTHRMEFTKGRYRGLDPTSESDWTTTILMTHLNRHTGGFLADTEILAFSQPIAAFAPGGRNYWILETAKPTGGSAATVAYHPSEKCSTFEPGKKGFDLAHDKECGSGQVTFEGSSAVPMRTSFEALGLPLSSGKETLKSCHVDAEFQNVSMAGAARPFVFPKHATATWVFGDGKVLIECAYTPSTVKK